MKTKDLLRFVYFLFFIVVCAAQSIAEEGISIAGTYKLESRQLPDGTVLTPPRIEGLIDFSKEYVNFNLMWKDKGGKVLSISYVGVYRLTPSEYFEKSIYEMVNDEIHGGRVKYDFSQKSGISPVILFEGNIEFRFPLTEDLDASFSGDKFTAMRPRKYIDNWIKVQ